MSKKLITTEADKEAFLQIWKYVSANGKLFIPVYDGADESSVYVEEDGTGNKTIRVFMDSESIDLYIAHIEDTNQTEKEDGFLKIGIAPVKLLQKKLTEVYGSERTNDKTVECRLTSYDELGNMQDIDIIWTQASH